ncbi:MAG: histidine kinase [bacterium]|nr:histidine kinase [bacterium]
MTKRKTIAMYSTEQQEKNYLFWIINASGWLLLLLIYIVLYYSERLGETKTILGLTITYIAGFIISIPLRYFYKKVDYQKRSILKLVLIVLLGSFLASNLWLFVDMISSLPLHGKQVLESWLKPRYYVNSIYSHLWVLTLWSTLYFIIKLWKAWTLQKERTEKATALAQAAQLQMLRYQLNPHFLFNALNSVRALIDEDTRNAKKVITELSEFLRYSLISKTYSDVPLSQELEAIRHYFAIEKIRYEEKLDVAFDIDPLAEDYPVLSFLIHPLIENAIKYGMQTSSMPLKIRVKAFVENGNLKVEISNTGKWLVPSEKENTNSTGTGLENVRQRLENAFPDRHRLEVFEEEGWVHVLLEIRDGG